MTHGFAHIMSRRRAEVIAQPLPRAIERVEEVEEVEDGVEWLWDLLHTASRGQVLSSMGGVDSGW